MRCQSLYLWKPGLLGILVFMTGSLGVALPQSRPTLVGESDPLPIFFQPDALVMARWDWGALVGVEENDCREPLLYRVDREGKPERIRLAIPGVGWIRVYDVAGGPGGALAASGSCYSDDGKAGCFVAWIGPDRKRQTVTRTSPHVPFRIAVASDGKVWTAGWALTADGHLQRSNVFRRFDTSGQVLNTFEVRGGVPDTGTDAVGLSLSRSSPDRVGWLTGGLEYVEFSLEGSELNRFNGPRLMGPANAANRGLALGEDNEASLGVVVRGQPRLWSLDRQRRTWIPCDSAEAERSGCGSLLGSDGQFLVARCSHQIIRRYGVATPETK